jgi:hypothetical protein
LLNGRLAICGPQICIKSQNWLNALKNIVNSPIENGEPGIALGTFLCVLWKLALLDTIRGVANPDTDDHGKMAHLNGCPAPR